MRNVSSKIAAAANKKKLTGYGNLDNREPLLLAKSALAIRVRISIKEK